MNDIITPENIYIGAQIYNIEEEDNDNTITTHVFYIDRDKNLYILRIKKYVLKVYSTMFYKTITTKDLQHYRFCPTQKFHDSSNPPFITHITQRDCVEHEPSFYVASAAESASVGWTNISNWKYSGMASLLHEQREILNTGEVICTYPSLKRNFWQRLFNTKKKKIELQIPFNPIIINLKTD